MNPNQTHSLREKINKLQYDLVRLIYLRGENKPLVRRQLHKECTDTILSAFRECVPKIEAVKETDSDYDEAFKHGRNLVIDELLKKLEGK